MNFIITLQSLLFILLQFDKIDCQYEKKPFVSAGAYKTTSSEGNWNKTLIDGDVTTCETTLLTENIPGKNYPYELRAAIREETSLDRVVLVMASQSNIRINQYREPDRYCEFQMTSPKQDVIFEGECLSRNFDKKVGQVSITFPNMEGKPIVICEVSFYNLPEQDKVTQGSTTKKARVECPIYFFLELLFLFIWCYFQLLL